MESLEVERVDSVRRLGAERMNLGFGLSTPLDEFEFVALVTVHDEYNPLDGHIGPLRWYVTFFDASGSAIPLAFIDSDSRDEALSVATGIGVPEGEWTTALGVPLKDDRSLPMNLLAGL